MQDSKYDLLEFASESTFDHLKNYDEGTIRETDRENEKSAKVMNI
jgi:hypothetical protein